MSLAAHEYRAYATMKGFYVLSTQKGDGTATKMGELIKTRAKRKLDQTENKPEYEPDPASSKPDPAHRKPDQAKRKPDQAQK